MSSFALRYWLVVMIPRLVIQPLIENAFEHGVKARLSDGLITVSYCEMKDGFQIHVDDNGDTASDKDIQHIQALIEDQSNQNDGEFGIALLNIQKRL